MLFIIIFFFFLFRLLVFFSFWVFVCFSIVLYLSVCVCVWIMTHPQHLCFLLLVPLAVCLWALSPVLCLAASLLCSFDKQTDESPDDLLRLVIVWFTLTRVNKIFIRYIYKPGSERPVCISVLWESLRWNTVYFTIWHGTGRKLGAY